jgi:hypothetical protein
VFVNDFSPTDRYLRRHWLDKLHLEFKVKMYRYSHGNLESMTFFWRVPSDSAEEHTSTARAIAVLKVF